jgi:thiol-disulfide isomerase/thioredoxin
MTTPTTRRGAGRLLLVALAAALAVAGCSTGKDAVSQGGDFQFVSPGGQTRIFYPPDKRGRAPDIGGESLLEPGKQIKLSDYPNQVVVLNLWGSWCGPCRTETSQLEQVYQQTRASGVQVVGIDLRDADRNAPTDFVRDRALTYPSIYDPPGRSLFALKGYPKSVVPSTVVLDRQHRVAAIYLEAILASDILPEVHQLAAERT